MFEMIILLSGGVMAHQLRTIVPSYFHAPQVYTLRIEQGILGQTGPDVDKNRYILFLFMRGVKTPFVPEMKIDFRVCLSLYFFRCVFVFLHPAISRYFCMYKHCVELSSVSSI